LIPGAELIDGQHINSSFVSHLFDVCTCGKSLIIAGENDYADCIILVKLSQCIA
jgi:hypothetical protein